jgi:hypothetical protein
MIGQTQPFFPKAFCFGILFSSMKGITVSATSKTACKILARLGFLVTSSIK